MPDTNMAAIWSAVAASCSAIAAWSSLLLNRRAGIEAVRPDLLLGEWKLIKPSSAPRIEIHIGNINNYGKGPARYVHLAVEVPVRHAHFAGMTLNVIVTIPPAQAIQPDGYAVVLLQPDYKKQAEGLVPARITVTYYDIRGNRYRQDLRLLANLGEIPIAGARQLAPNLYALEERIAFTSSFYVNVERRYFRTRNKVLQWFGQIRNLPGHVNGLLGRRGHRGTAVPVDSSSDESITEPEEN
jgi:hypothetical protein